MENKKWKISRKEKVEKNGMVVSRKLMYEPVEQTTRFQRFREWAELIVKLSGLVVVIIAIFSYLGKLKDANEEQIRKNKVDSISEVKYQREQLRQFKADSLTTAEFRDTQQRNDSEQLRLNTALKLQERELIDKMDKEKTDYYVAALVNTSTNMEIVIAKPFGSDAYIKAKENLLFELYPKLELISNDSVMKIFEAFEHMLTLTELFQESRNRFDSCSREFAQLYFKVFRNIYKPTRPIDSLHILAILDSLFLEEKSSLFSDCFYDNLGTAKNLANSMANYKNNFQFELINSMDSGLYECCDSLSDYYTQVGRFGRQLLEIKRILPSLNEFARQRAFKELFEGNKHLQRPERSAYIFGTFFLKFEIKATEKIIKVYFDKFMRHLIDFYRHK